MFEGKNTKKIEYLESEKDKLWERIVALEDRIEKKTIDYEKEAKQASKKAAEYRNKAEERFNQSERILADINSVSSIISNASSEIENIKNTISETLESSKNQSEEIINLSEVLIQKTEKIQEIFENHPDLSDEVEELESILTTLNENASKANVTYKGILSKKTEIDELHREIIGYEDEDEDGEIVEIDGLKTNLETSFDDLKENIENLKHQVEEIKEEGKKEINGFIENNEEELKIYLDKSQSEYNEIRERIASLLPDALTTGLSSAFVAKKKEEEKIYDEYKNKFNRGIWILVFVSLLPIILSIIFLINGDGLIEVIERAPKIVLAFLPIYIPLVWSTISANKKVNLSKRLIEEYSHKQVLSMTIEGLSNQINNIKDSDISSQLRIQLLYNFLQVSSENPGKLISNYERSDNPIFEYFEKKKTPKSEVLSDKKTISETITDRTKSIINKTADEFENGVVESIKKSLPD